MNLSKKLFSISNEKDHKICYILGFKFKFKNNHIKKPCLINGEIEYPISYKGIEIHWTGTNSIIEIFEPVNIENSKFFLGNNNTIKLKNTEYKVYSLNIYMINANNCNVNIGKNVSINGCDIEANNTNEIFITIGNESMLSSDITLRAHDAHKIYDINSQEIINLPKRGITIGKHCWIAQYVKILKNCIIPDDSIVGLGSIVTKSFNENNVIIAGNPAKIVKRNVTWQR